MNLSDKEKQIVLFVRTFIRVNKYAPSFREIASAVDLPYGSTLHELMKSIREKGYIGYIDRKSRALWMTEKGEQV